LGAGNALANTITGGAGNDDLSGGAGVDLLQGNAGDDVYRVDSVLDIVAEADGGGSDTVVATSSSYTLGAHLEKLRFQGAGGFAGTGNALANSISGGTAGDTLEGRDGNDALSGLEGADTLLGGTGNDWLDGGIGGGTDTLAGGAGNDTYVVDRWLSGPFDIVLELEGEGVDTIRTALANYTLPANVENLVLTGTDKFIFARGNALANAIIGTASIDSLVGEAGNDWLVGNAGDDKLDGGTGADRMMGGTGNDGYAVDDIGDVVTELAGEGTDSIGTALTSYTLPEEVENLRFTGDVQRFSGTGNGLANRIEGGLLGDTLSGKDGDDVLVGKQNGDLLIGGAGNDVLDGGQNLDTLIGGSGDDRYIVLEAGDILVELPDQGIDTVQAALAVYVLPADFEDLALTGPWNATGVGNAGANTLTGTPGNDSLFGGEGGDTLAGGAGIDRLAGGAGDDTYRVDLADVVDEAAGEGTDTVIAGGASYTLGQNLENLRFVGAGGFSGTGNELANSISGGAGNDTLSGGDGNDSLSGLAGADALSGGAGNDWLNGGEGADAMAGGTDNDTYVVDNELDLVFELAGEGGDSVSTALFRYALVSEVENLVFSGSGDFFGIGNALANVIAGSAGADVLDGAGGDDRLIGGGGNDTYRVDGALDVVSEAAGQGTDTVLATSASYVLSADVENLRFMGSGAFAGSGNALANSMTGGPSNDVLNGADGNDAISGLAGADAIDGGAGNDWLNGGDDSDALRGGIGNDTLVGGTGDDVLAGDAGDDRLDGGGGNDVFVFSPGFGRDLIQAGFDADPTLGQDLLDISALGITAVTLASAVSIGASGADTLITIGAARVLLEGVSPSAIDASDFLLAS
jgi:Ca2+-binding RTX toxin-like protein